MPLLGDPVRLATFPDDRRTLIVSVWLLGAPSSSASASSLFSSSDGGDDCRGDTNSNLSLLRADIVTKRHYRKKRIHYTAAVQSEMLLLDTEGTNVDGVEGLLNEAEKKRKVCPVCTDMK